MEIVPLDPVPSQTLSIVLNQQSCTIHVYQVTTGLYLDLSMNDALVVGGVLCLDRNKIVRSAYLGFTGDLGFFDTQGTTDPVYTGLGSRYLLVYLTPAELAVTPTIVPPWSPAAVATPSPTPTPTPSPTPTPTPTPTPAPTPAGAPGGVFVD